MGGEHASETSQRVLMYVRSPFSSSTCSEAGSVYCELDMGPACSSDAA